mgnify:FL=1
MGIQVNWNMPDKLQRQGPFIVLEDGLLLEDYKFIHNLRRQGKLEEARLTLLKAITGPAIADELRKTLSAEARLAAKENNWEIVKMRLETYLEYAEENRQICIKTVNQEPPDLTPTEQNLLEKARTILEPNVNKNKC